MMTTRKQNNKPTSLLSIESTFVELAVGSDHLRQSRKCSRMQFIEIMLFFTAFSNPTSSLGRLGNIKRTFPAGSQIAGTSSARIR